MSGDYQNDSGGTTASTPRAEGDYLETDAARVGGWGTEPPAADLSKITFQNGGPSASSDSDDEEEWQRAREWAREAPRWSGRHWGRVNASLGYRISTRK